MLDDIELELAAIKLTADRERLDHARPQPHRSPAAGAADPKVIGTRGLNINKMAADSLPKPVRRSDAQPSARPSLAERLASVRADAAE